MFHDPPQEETATIIAQARERLVAAGWQADPLWIQGDGGQQFEASHDGLNIRIDAIADSSSWSSMDVVISKDFTVVSVAAMIVGTIGGLVGGWLLAVWVLRRWHRHGRPRRAMVVAAAVPVLVIGPLSVLVTALFGVVSTTGEISPKIMQTPMITLVWLWQITMVAVASGLLAIALAVFPARRALPIPAEQVPA